MHNPLLLLLIKGALAAAPAPLTSACPATTAPACFTVHFVCDAPHPAFNSAVGAYADDHASLTIIVSTFGDKTAVATHGPPAAAECEVATFVVSTKDTLSLDPRPASLIAAATQSGAIRVGCEFLSPSASLYGEMRAIASAPYLVFDACQHLSRTHSHTLRGGPLVASVDEIISRAILDLCPSAPRAIAPTCTASAAMELLKIGIFWPPTSDASYYTVSSWAASCGGTVEAIGFSTNDETLAPRQDLDVLLLPGGDWQGGGRGGIHDIVPGGALALQLTALVDVAVASETVILGVCTGWLFLAQHFKVDALTAITPVTRVDRTHASGVTTLQSTASSGFALACTASDEQTIAITNFNTLGVTVHDVMPEWIVLAHEADGGTVAETAADTSTHAAWVQLATHTSVGAMYGAQWHPYGHGAAAVPVSTEEAALSAALIAGITAKAAETKLAGAFVTDTRAMRCLVEAIASLGDADIASATMASSFAEGLQTVYATPASTLSGLTAPELEQLAIATVGATSAAEVLTMNGTAHDTGATDEELVAQLTALVDADLAHLLGDGTGTIDFSIEHEGFLSIGEIALLPSGTEAELVTKAVALLKTVSEGGNVTATSHVYDRYDLTRTPWSPSELHIVLQAQITFVNTTKESVLLQSKEIKQAVMEFIIANSDELGWLFASEGDYSYNHVQFASVAEVGDGSVNVVIRLTGCWMQEARVFMTMLSDATGTQIDELVALIETHSGLTVTTETLVAVSSSSDAGGSSSSSSASADGTAALAIRNDLSDDANAKCLTMIGGLAPGGLACTFPKIFDGVTYTEEMGCIPGPYPLAPSSWTNQDGGFCFTAQGVWGNCGCNLDATVGQQAALEEELILLLEEVACDPTIWEDYERTEALTLISMIATLAQEPTHPIIDGTLRAALNTHGDQLSAAFPTAGFPQSAVATFTDGGVERAVAHAIANGCISTPLPGILEWEGPEDEKKRKLRERVVEYDKVRVHVNTLIAAGSTETVVALFEAAATDPMLCLISAVPE